MSLYKYLTNSKKLCYVKMSISLNNFRKLLKKPWKQNVKKTFMLLNFFLSFNT